MKTGDWTFNDKEDGCWNREQFATKEEAIEAAIQYSKEDEHQPMVVGQIEETSVPNPIDASDLIDQASQMLDDDGSEWDAGEIFYESIDKEQINDLQEMLDKAYWSWVEKHKIVTNSFTIVNIEEVTPNEPV